MKKEKPPIAVIDDSLRGMPQSFINDAKWINAVAPQARRFILTDDASVHFGELVRDTEDLMLRNHQFAIPPFETTYIEFNCRLTYFYGGKRASTKNVNGQTVYEPTYNSGLSHRDFEANPLSDDRVGYLMHKGHIWTFCRQVNGQVGLSPWKFEDSLGHADSLPWPTNMNEMTRALGPDRGPLAVMLGTGVHKADEQTMAEIRARFSLHPALAVEKAYRRWDTWVTSTGDLRNIIGLLLLLNTPQHVTFASQERRVGLYHGKRMVYHAHQTVEIELGRVRDIKRLWRHQSDRASPRRHSVRGHFVHYHLVKGCSHEWPVMPEGGADGAPRWQCVHCQGFRVWKKDYYRGDASIGVVTKDYLVT